MWLEYPAMTKTCKKWDKEYLMPDAREGEGVFVGDHRRFAYLNELVGGGGRSRLGHHPRGLDLDAPEGKMRGKQGDQIRIRRVIKHPNAISTVLIDWFLSAKCPNHRQDCKGYPKVSFASCENLTSR